MGDKNPRAQEALQVGVSEPPGPWAASYNVSLGLAMTLLLLHGCFFFFFSVYFWRGHTGVNYKEPRESCPSHTVRCDGVEDCKLKSDELGCGKEVGCVRVFVRILWRL